MWRNKEIIQNTKFWMLTIINECKPRDVSKSRPNGYRYVTCKCDCWNIVECNYSRVKTWRTVSCWCYAKKVASELMKENKIWVWRTHTTESRAKMSKTKWWNKDRLINIIRASFEYKQWRKLVYERDWYKCRISWIKWNGNLEAHHIVNLKKIIQDNNIKTFKEALMCKEIWDIENWITIDKTLHSIFHKKYWYFKNSIEQIIDFKNNQNYAN